MNKLLKNVLRLSILLITVTVFAYYVAHHPDLLHQLARTPAHVVVVLVLLYLAWFGTIGLNFHATLRMCRRPLHAQENVLLSAYSTLVNFFVPGQGGVALRGLYMKKQHQLEFRYYILATLIYYMCYALVSAAMFLLSSSPWWQFCIGIASVAGGSVLVVRMYQRRFKASTDSLILSPKNLAFLLIATVAQTLTQAAVYGYELRAVNPSISLSQILTYTGAANFSVFVALTPGAIGIRESFLLLSEKLHHINTSTILAASILDRSVFLVVLGLLFIISQIFHAKKNLGM